MSGYEKARTEKHNAKRQRLRDKLTAVARQAGFEIHELFGGISRRAKVAVKYRDKNATPA